ncbi:MAG: RNA 2',3'-cyclic phosphodiesterase [Burkholderiaceae bacterium]
MKSNERNVRLFYALWPDDATRAALAMLQTYIQGRITPAEDLHLTLTFLGTQPFEALPVLQTLMAKLPAAAMTLKVDCLGYFSNNGIAWAGMQRVPDALFTLRHTLFAALAQQTIAVKQSMHFKPHITLARDAAAIAARDVTPIIWRADHIALVQSNTGGNAPRYRLLASHQLENS